MEENKSESPVDKIEAEAGLPPIDFSTFVMSLATSVLLYLGEVPNPETKTTEKNLPLARHTIDLLSLIKDKTKGNLTEEEEKLVESLLYDLRTRYLKIAGGK